MSSNVVRVSKKGGIKSLLKRFTGGGNVDVGIIDAGKHDDSDLTVASIGFINEFGAPAANIPQRSFLRSTTFEQRKNIVSFQKSLLLKIKEGKLDEAKALGLLGEFVADLVRVKITKLSKPPNKPETITRKGSSNPLVDSGQLRNSITYKVNL